MAQNRVWGYSTVQFAHTGVEATHGTQVERLGFQDWGSELCLGLDLSKAKRLRTGIWAEFAFSRLGLN